MTRRERVLRRQIRDVWTELIKERSDHVRAAALHRKLADLKARLAEAKGEQ